MTTFPPRSFWAGLVATGALIGAVPAHAVVLPSSNVMSTVQYGDFAVYSLDLLQQCVGALDSRCLPGGPFPVESNAGFTKTQLTVLTGEAGKPQTSNQPEPLAKGAPADNAFASPSGQQSSTLLMGSAVSPEPTPTFTGDQPGKWDIKISALRGYLGSNDLVFIFDNAQEGDGANRWLQIWGLSRVLSADGTSQHGCFELNSSSAAGCTTSSPSASTGPFDLSSPYVTVFAGYCVNKIPGAAFNLGGGTSATCEAQNGYLGALMCPVVARARIDLPQRLTYPASAGFFVWTCSGRMLVCDDGRSAWAVAAIGRTLERWMARTPST